METQEKRFGSFLSRRSWQPANGHFGSTVHVRTHCPLRKSDSFPKHKLELSKLHQFELWNSSRSRDAQEWLILSKRVGHICVFFPLLSSSNALTRTTAAPHLQGLHKLWICVTGCPDAATGQCTRRQFVLLPVKGGEDDRSDAKPCRRATQGPAPALYESTASLHEGMRD